MREREKESIITKEVESVYFIIFQIFIIINYYILNLLWNILYL